MSSTPSSPADVPSSEGADLPYPEVPTRADFPAIERRILARWADQSTFERSVELRPEDDEFVFYDGPPFANGLPHYGHLLTGYVKDVVPRYQTMRGHRVDRHAKRVDQRVAERVRLVAAVERDGGDAVGDGHRDEVGGGAGGGHVLILGWFALTHRSDARSSSARRTARVAAGWSSDPRR
jgi:hypothetical protein